MGTSTSSSTPRHSYEDSSHFTTSATTTRAGSPISNEASKRIPDSDLKPGLYYIVSDQNHNMVLDLAGYDWTTILAFAKHGGNNQKWEFSRLGAGYSIKSLQNGCYITLQSGDMEDRGMIATPYPVSWELEADPYDSALWRIRWPRSPYVFDLLDPNGHAVQLRNSYPFKPTRLWRLLPAEPQLHEANNTLEFTTYSPKELKAEPPAVTTSDTVVDVEGLKLGGNGEMSITTTTTTVTTSITKVKRLGAP